MIRALATLLMLTVGASLEQTTATDLDAWGFDFQDLLLKPVRTSRR